MGSYWGIQISMGQCLGGEGENSRKAHSEQSKGCIWGKEKATRLCNEAIGDYSESYGEFLPNIYHRLEREDCLHAHSEFKHYSRDQKSPSRSRSGDRVGGCVNF